MAKKKRFIPRTDRKMLLKTAEDSLDNCQVVIAITIGTVSLNKLVGESDSLSHRRGA